MSGRFGRPFEYVQKIKAIWLYVLEKKNAYLAQGTWNTVKVTTLFFLLHLESPKVYRLAIGWVRMYNKVSVQAWSDMYSHDISQTSYQKIKLPGKPVAVNFHQLYPWNQPQLPNKNGTLGFTGDLSFGEWLSFTHLKFEHIQHILSENSMPYLRSLRHTPNHVAHKTCACWS